jgi:hypothetical protein
MKHTVLATKPTVKLDDWLMRTPTGDGYTAPEVLHSIAASTVVGTRPDGKSIRSSSIVKITGRLVETRNTIYQLGRINRGFRAWLRKEGNDYDPKHPLKWREQ